MTDNSQNHPMPGQPLLALELKPHRSGRPNSGFIFLLVLGFFWSIIGGGAAYFRVWPLSVFYGVEFLLILGIIRMFVAAGTRVETITLSADVLRVTRPGRYHNEKSFNPQAVNVSWHATKRGSGRIDISDDIEQMTIGTLLSANECESIAKQVNDALAKFF